MEILNVIIDSNILAQVSVLYEFANQFLSEFAVFAAILLVGCIIAASVLIIQGSYQAAVGIFAGGFLIGVAPHIARFCISLWQNVSLGGF